MFRIAEKPQGPQAAKTIIQLNAMKDKQPKSPFQLHLQNMPYVSSFSAPTASPPHPTMILVIDRKKKWEKDQYENLLVAILKI